jgi:alpha-L-fucosidase 2
MSPLWGLYPGWDITPADGPVYDAAKVLLTWRGDGDTGWSFAWRMPLWARVNDGEFAHRQLYGLLNRRTLPNLFDLCGPFQIDGNFGACAGIAEMLLQSHITENPGQASGSVGPHSAVRILNLLPALPKAWPAGSVEGLLARGGFEVDIAWSDGELSQAVIHSRLGAPCRLRWGDAIHDLDLEAGDEFVWDGQP